MNLFFNILCILSSFVHGILFLLVKTVLKILRIPTMFSWELKKNVFVIFIKEYIQELVFTISVVKYISHSM